MFDFAKALDSLTKQREALIKQHETTLAQLLKLDGAIEAVQACQEEAKKEETPTTPAEDFEGKEPVK